MRPNQDPSGGPSATPIYDSLYAEWVRTYRTLPGDRHGEEDLGFTGFGSLSHGAGGQRATGSFATGSFATGSFASGSYGSRHAAGHLATQRESQPGHTTTTTAVWQPVGRIPTGHTGMHHIPSPLPPGPRRGH
ncbi:hypothetical protein [Streptomyces akebiae]|uniref:Uncharacterized protein n=1 Tax=Streptomyces akebiae TaxID=2865673 RepID=A0ABX8Y031_9ACTN|nr:hypothetical protein [Streptomyces akebiae]QYX81124.1 hypothetical protein K1J60_35395 [Streptomyces akebiae]